MKLFLAILILGSVAWGQTNSSLFDLNIKFEVCEASCITNFGGAKVQSDYKSYFFRVAGEEGAVFQKMKNQCKGQLAEDGSIEVKNMGFYTSGFTGSVFQAKGPGFNGFRNVESSGFYTPGYDVISKFTPASEKSCKITDLNKVIRTNVETYSDYSCRVIVGDYEILKIYRARLLSEDRASELSRTGPMLVKFQDLMNTKKCAVLNDFQNNKGKK